MPSSLTSSAVNLLISLFLSLISNLRSFIILSNCVSDKSISLLTILVPIIGSFFATNLAPLNFNVILLSFNS